MKHNYDITLFKNPDGFTYEAIATSQRALKALHLQGMGYKNLSIEEAINLHSYLQAKGLNVFFAGAKRNPPKKQNPPKFQSIGYNHYIISGITAGKLLEGKTLAPGKERLVLYDGKYFFLKRDRYNEKSVWALVGPTHWRPTEKGMELKGNPPRKIKIPFTSLDSDIRRSNEHMRQATGLTPRQHSRMVRKRMIAKSMPAFDPLLDKDKVKGNPPLVEIYSHCIEIKASKAGLKHHCDAKCKAANHRYVHTFKGKTRTPIFGLPDGRFIVG